MRHQETHRIAFLVEIQENSRKFSNLLDPSLFELNLFNHVKSVLMAANKMLTAANNLTNNLQLCNSIFVPSFGRIFVSFCLS